MRHELDGWRSVHGRGADGSIESDERVTAASPVVERSEAGAHYLGERYWREVASASRGLVRARTTGDGVELRLFERGPSLLRFGLAETMHDAGDVRCRYSIRGGLLARRPGGTLTLSQTGAGRPELRAAVHGFAPRLGSRPYDRIQRRLHVAVSRRYFRSLIDEARP
jgi:hypothetical protein